MLGAWDEPQNLESIAIIVRSSFPFLSVALLLHVVHKDTARSEYTLCSRSYWLHPTLKRALIGGHEMRQNWGTRAVFIISLSLCAPAWAATLEVVKGDVSVKQGEGFRRVAGATEVYTGNQVMARPGGQARIVYPDGCVVKVYPGSVMAVPGKCYTPMTAGLEPLDEKALVPPPTPFPWVPVVLGGLIVGGGICAVVCGDHDNPRPRSP